MDASPGNDPCAILDASLLIGFSANEADKAATAQATLDQYTAVGWRFYAPGVAISETLHILCQKHQSGKMTTAEFDLAIERFDNLMTGVLPSPHGDSSLVLRAAQIGRSYGCARSSDSIYLALAEQLTTVGTAELATFDAGMKSQAAAAAPSVVVRLLPVAVPVQLQGPSTSGSTP